MIILDSGRGGALKPKDGLGITGSFQNHRRKHGQRGQGFGGGVTESRRRPCGTVSTEFSSSVGGARSTVSPGRDRAGPSRRSSALRSAVRDRPSAQDATVRDQLGGVQVFGRGCSLNRRHRQLAGSTSATNAVDRRPSLVTFSYTLQ